MSFIGRQAEREAFLIVSLMRDADENYVVRVHKNRLGGGGEITVGALIWELLTVYAAENELIDPRDRAAAKAEGEAYAKG